MKKFNDLFEKVCLFENLHFAYLEARKCKRYREEILAFGFDLEKNLLSLRDELAARTYRHGGYREFIVNDSKKRRIQAAPFRDRVVHHALCNIIEPIFDKGFIYDSYACRIDKGTHKALKRLKTFLRSMAFMERERERERESRNAPREIYCLQCDISKYFDSISHKVLFSILKRKIRDEKTLWLIKEILDSNNKETGKGIPIGNLTSQLFANVYLNELDQFVKRELKQQYYLRYMDDFLIFGADKQELWLLKDAIAEFLKTELDLSLHPKKANVYPASGGVAFLGYRNFAAYRLPLKVTVRRFEKKLKKRQRIGGGAVERSFDSFANFTGFARAWKLARKIEDKFLPGRTANRELEEANARLQIIREERAK